MIPEAAKGTLIRRYVLRGAISNYAGTLIALAAGFFLTPFVLSHLGPTSYGLWMLVNSVVGYSALLDFGIGSAVIKYVAGYYANGETEEAHALVATALCLYTGLSLIVMALSAAIAPFFPYLFNVPPDNYTAASWLLLLCGVDMAISILCTTPEAVLRGLQRFELINFTNTIGLVISVAATVVILPLGGGVLSMVAINIPTTLLMQALNIWVINRIAPELRFGWRGASRHLVRTIISFSSSIFMIRVSARLQSRTDEIVIGAFLQLSAVAPYAISRRLGEAAQLLADQFMKVLLPVASQLHAESDHARLRSLYIMGTRLTLAIFLPLGCILCVLTRPILTLWVGAAYADYAHLAIILTFATLVDTIHWPGGAVLQGMGRHRPMAVMTLCAALANLGLSVALVRDFGLTGVALGTLLPTLAVSLLKLSYALQVIDVSVTKALTEIFLPVLLPAAPAAIMLYVLQNAIEPSSLLSMMVVAGLGLLVYVVGYLSVGAGEVERQTYRSIALSTIRFVEDRFKPS